MNSEYFQMGTSYPNTDSVSLYSDSCVVRPLETDPCDTLCHMDLKQLRCDY